jgi:hypothetical protein
LPGNCQEPRSRSGLVTHLLRAALARKCTADPAYLTCLAEDALVTIGLRTDPEHDKALAQAAKEPAGPGGSIDVEKILRERGL